MKILFMGTPEFAVPCFEALADSRHEVCGAVTQPDKPAGRGHKLTAPPVKVSALSRGIDVFQPETLKDGAFENELNSLAPDLIAVVAYGKILPEYILSYPKYGCVNIHASLLPKYRGAGPIQWSVINGEKKTGITSMMMEKGLDTGDMLLRRETEIGEYETAAELHDRLMHMGARLLLDTVDGLENGGIAPEKQNDAEACYAPMLSRELAKIDWSADADRVLHLIHGMNSWPVAHTLYMGEKLKIYRAVRGKEDCTEDAGRILSADSGGIEVACGKGSIILTEVQFSGSRAMRVCDYLNGHSVAVGEILK